MNPAHRRTDAPTHRCCGGHGGTGARGHGGAAACAISTLTALVLWTRPAVAQLGVSGSAAAAFAEHRVSAGRGTEQSSGTLLGGHGKIVVGSRFELAGQVLGGQLTADSASSDDLDLAELEVRASVLPAPWLALQGGFSARSYATTFARQRWMAARFGAEVRLAFVGGALRGVLRGELLPAVSVNDLENPSGAFAAAAGLEWRGGILAAAVQYSLERYDFPLVGDVRRREQLSVLTGRVGLSLGRP